MPNIGVTPSEINSAEHDSGSGVQLKKVGLYGWDTAGLAWVKLLVDASGNLQSETASYGTIAGGRKTVTTAGTRIVLAASTACKKVKLQALPDNTDIVYVGGSDVVAADNTENGYGLYATNSVEFEVNNLNLIFVDSRVSGEGVSFSYIV